MIEATSLSARSASGMLEAAVHVRNVTFRWDRGVLAIVGSKLDGTATLLDVLAGLRAHQSGRVTVDGRSPRAARAAIAHVPADAALPDSLRVDEVCALAAALRGEPASPATARLAPLGLETLAARKARSLTPAETRAVVLALALSSQARVLLVEEPLAGLAPAAPARVAELLRARAAAGACVIVTTASVRDATRVADQLAVLTRGTFAHLPPALAHTGPGGAKLRVVVRGSATRDAAPFVAELAAETAVASVETATFAAAGALSAGAVSVVVTGSDLLTLARAVSAAAARAGAAVEAIESAVMPLDAIRASLAAPRPAALPSHPPPAARAAPASGGAA